MGQETGEKGSAAVDLLPTIPKSDRLLAFAGGFLCLAGRTAEMDFDFADREGMREQIALSDRTAAGEQGVLLFRGLDAFRDHPHP
jgi:hypothetical protein